MPITKETADAFRASGWSEEKILSASKRKDQRIENGLILDAFIDHIYLCNVEKIDYDDCEIEREDGKIFVRWSDPQYMRNSLSPRIFHVFKVNHSYAFEEV